MMRLFSAFIAASLLYIDPHLLQSVDLSPTDRDKIKIDR